MTWLFTLFTIFERLLCYTEQTKPQLLRKSPSFKVKLKIWRENEFFSYSSSRLFELNSYPPWKFEQPGVYCIPNFRVIQTFKSQVSWKNLSEMGSILRDIKVVKCKHYANHVSLKETIKVMWQKQTWRQYKQRKSAIFVMVLCFYMWLLFRLCTTLHTVCLQIS